MLNVKDIQEKNHHDQTWYQERKREGRHAD